MPSVLIVDYFEDQLLSQLKGFHSQIIYMPDSTRKDLLNLNPNVGCLVLKSKTNIDEEFLSYYPGLQTIIRAGAGVDHINTALLEEKKIKLVTTNAGSRDAVGEHTTGMLLALLNFIPRANAEVRSFIWKREANRGHEVKGKTIGIIGYGNMGSAFAEKISGFGAHVIAYDKYKSKFSSRFVKEVQMNQIFEETDILSLHVPLTNETKYLVDLPYIQRFKKNIWLINLARGQVVKTEDLIIALKSGKIKGAALDVLENENFHQLSIEEQKQIITLSEQNVIFTPHIGGWTFESAANINQIVKTEIENYLKQNP
jgi:D-3-phosphoglycerate dehydrogenase